MLQYIHPPALYAACGIRAIGVCIARSRREGKNPQILGAVIASLAGAVVLIDGTGGGRLLWRRVVAIYLLLCLRVPGSGCFASGDHLSAPGVRGYSLRAEHPATAGLFLLLSAEFMAFALVIVVRWSDPGSLYLFVIMLADPGPDGRDGERP